MLLARLRASVRRTTGHSVRTTRIARTLRFPRALQDRTAGGWAFLGTDRGHGTSREEKDCEKSCLHCAILPTRENLDVSSCMFFQCFVHGLSAREVLLTGRLVGPSEAAREKSEPGWRRGDADTEGDPEFLACPPPAGRFSPSEKLLSERSQATPIAQGCGQTSVGGFDSPRWPMHFRMKPRPCEGRRGFFILRALALSLLEHPRATRASSSEAPRSARSAGSTTRVAGRGRSPQATASSSRSGGSPRAQYPA